MRVLALDAALGRAMAALVIDGVVLAARESTEPEGIASRLPVLAQAVLHEAGGENWFPADLIAVTTGPGSFTGIRAALALAHGLSLGANVPLIGVTVGEATREMPVAQRGRRLWIAIDSRRGRAFLDDGNTTAAYSLEALPEPPGPVALAGDAAVAVAEAWAARGHDVVLTECRLPNATGIAVAALKRREGKLPPRDAQPFYLDPPEARLPRGGSRAAPV